MVLLYFIISNHCISFIMIIHHTGSQTGLAGMVLIYVGFCFQYSRLEMILDIRKSIVIGCQYE